MVRRISVGGWPARVKPTPEVLKYLLIRDVNRQDNAARALVKHDAEGLPAADFVVNPVDTH
jgi:hypothetical protein